MKKLWENCFVFLCLKQFMKVKSVGPIKNKKILILGGTGFLGNKLISSLLNDNLQIYLLVRNSRTRNDLQKYNPNPNIKIFDWKGTDLKIIEKNWVGVIVGIKIPSF